MGASLESASGSWGESYRWASWRRGFRLYRVHPFRHAGRWLAFMGRRLMGDRMLWFRDGAGHRLVSPRENFTAMAVAVLGERDPDVMCLLRRWVRPGDAVFDVGANIGTYALPLGRLVGEAGRVVAFEPNRPTRACLRHNVRQNQLRQVTVVAAAAGPAVGKVRLVAPNENQGEVHVAVDTHGDVVMSTIDAEAGRAGISGVRYIKLDVEGFELEALRGATAVMAASPELLIQTEWVPAHGARFGATWADLRAFLAERGFAPHRCDETGVLQAVSGYDPSVSDWFWLRSPASPVGAVE